MNDNSFTNEEIIPIVERMGMDAGPLKSGYIADLEAERDRLRAEVERLQTQRNELISLVTALSNPHKTPARVSANPPGCSPGGTKEGT